MSAPLTKFPRVSLTRKRAMKAAREVRRDGVNCTPEMTRRCGSETCDTEIEPGAAAPPTTAVGTDVAFVVPYGLVAATSIRMVWPTSLEPRRCDWPPPPNCEQLFPTESHRSHWKEYLV